MANMDLFGEFNRLQKEIDKISDTGARQIAREYANALEKLRNIVRRKYDEYGKEGKLTYEEMVKYDRVKKVDKELAAAVRTMHVQTSKITRKILKDTYKNGFESVRNAVGQAAGKTIRGQIKQEVINEALQNPVSGLTLNDRLKVRRSRIITDIQETIGQGLYKGESYTDMSKRLKNSLEGDVVKAHRIVRTESHRVMEKSKMDTLEHATNQGVELRKYWLNSEDERVRSSHNHMGEKYSKEDAIPIDENFVNDKTGGEGPAPGQMGVAEDDIYCRCIFVTIVITDDGNFKNKKDSGTIMPDEQRFDTIEEWQNSLTDQQKKAIYNYTSSDYTNIRDYQMGNKSGSYEEIKIKANLIKEALKRAPNYKGKTFRGIAGLSDEAYKSIINKKEIAFDAFTSTSKSRGIASGFAFRKKNNILFKIESKTGADIEQLAKFANEKEVLFNKGSRFTVDKITKLDTQMIIEITEVI